MSCPNINSPEWKSLVDAIGENNAWKEFIVHGKIPDASLYDIEKKGTKVLYSIRTKSTAQIKKGIDPANIKTEQEIKHTKFILSGVLNTIGDISPNKKVAISPDKAFDKVKEIYTELKDSINLALENFVKSDQDLKDIQSSPAFEELKKDFPVIGWVDSYDDLLKASKLYSEIVQNFKKYKSFVTVELAHKGIRIKKGKFEIVQPEDVENKEQDENEDTSIANEEVSKERFDRSAFEVNARETATVRVKGLVQTIQTGEFEFGIPLYADGDTVLDDILYAGTSMNLSGFTDKASKLEVFRAQLGMLSEGRPYLKSLLEKINKFETAGDWEIINQILTFASKAYAEETLLLYNLSKSGKKVRAVTKVKVVGSNRDKITDQVNRTWLSRHKISSFFNKSATGDLTPNMEKVNELNKIRLEGKALTGEAQVKKFIEYFNVLGIKFTSKDLDYIAPRLVSELRKGKSFERMFADGLLLDRIYKSFEKNEGVVFQDQYGFQDEKSDMKVLAKLYNEANPGLIKEPSTKTADNKSKHLNIQPSHVEISKREWNNSDGTNITNTVLAQPNSKEGVGFWSKVKQKIYKFVLGYFSGSREQEQNKDGKVRKSFTEKDQYASIIMKHQENMNEGTYITFTLSDKTTTMETKMTKEFFVDSKNAPVGLGKDYSIENGSIVYTDSLKDRVYNSFVEPEVSRIIASMKYADKVNLENFDVSSKLFYFFPKLNSDPSLQAFRDDLYSGTKSIEQLNDKYGKLVADVILKEFDSSANDQIKKFVTNGILEFKGGKYAHPLFLRSYVRRFEDTEASNAIITKLMMMDLKLNYMNAQIKTIQFLKFDPMHCFKAFKGFQKTDFNSISPEDKVKLANSTWDEFSKRAAALIAPGAQGNWSWKYNNNTKDYNSTTYRSVTLKDIKKDVAKYEGVETTDAQEFVTMQEHIDYLMSEGKIPMNVWETIHNKIEGAKNRPDRYYELDEKELKYVFSPTKPVYAGNSNEGDETGLNRFDYIKSSRFPLIPQLEAGSERDKLRVWMEKNNIQSAIFGSGKKAGRPTTSVEVFDKDNNFIDPVDFSKGIQELSRDGLRNQQEIPHQKDEIATVSQMNRTLFDGLLKSDFDFADMKKQTGAQLKSVKEKIRSRLFDIAADKLRDKLGNVNKTHEGLYKLLKETIENDTTGSYTENDLKSLELGKDGMFRKNLELQFKFPKFQGLINSMVNKNVMLKMNGTSFVQVSGAGTKFNFSDLSKGIKSGIIWTDSYAKTFKNGEATLNYISRKENGKVTPAQVIVSQYVRDEKGELIDLNDFITEKNGIKILDTSRLSPSLLQLVASRIPNQSHVSTLPIEVVGFLPTYMENTIIVPDGITGQMGSDFDVDKLYAYVSKTVKGENKKGQLTYGPIEYNLSNEADIDKLDEDQLNQALRDIHWNVLTHPDTFDNITKSVDNPEVKEKIKIREEQLKDHKISTDKGANLPLDFGRSIDRFIDNKSGKDGVSIYANLISAQADMQDKILTLGFYNTETEKNETVPIKIKLSKNGKEVIDLAYVGKTGKSKSFLNKVRTISDNLNMNFTESVDNAKNQLLRYFNWDNKSMGATGFLEMLSDENGQAVPIEFVMDLTSQPVIKNLLDLMDLKQDSFGEFDVNAIESSVEDLKETIKKTIDEQNILGGKESANTYFENPKRNKILDPETLADMWLVGQANVQPKEQRESSLKSIMKSLNDKYAKEKGGPTYNSIDDLLLEYYGVQYDSLDLFYDLHGKGRELMTILGSIYTYTKGIGSNIFVTMQKLNQLNKLAGSNNFLGIQNLAGAITKDDNGLISIAPEGEIGSSIENSLIFAQDELYLKLFPIATGKQLKDIVSTLLEVQGLEEKNVSKNKYESTHENSFRAVINYLYTVPELELFDNVVETRDKLINGDGSLGKRILNLTEKPEWAKNGFLKNLEVEPVWKSKAYSLSFKAPYGTDIDEKAVTSGFYELVISDDEEIRQIAKDLAMYPFATGDAGSIGRFIPVDYTMNDKDFSKAIGRIRGTYVTNMKAGGIPVLIDQIVQNNPEEYSKKFDFSSVEGDGDSPFKSALRPLIGKANDLINVSKLKFTLGNFKQQFIKDSLKVALTEREIALIKAQDSTFDPMESDGKTPKTKYPPYILITDSYEGVFNSFADRSVKYLYKRTSSLVEPVAEYERINILGIGNIKEYSFDNPELKSVIDNNAVDTTRIEMQSDEPDMSFGLTKDSFEDYSIKAEVIQTPVEQRQTDFGDYRLLYNEKDGDYDLMGPDGLEGERLSYEESVEYINMKLAGLDQPISTVVAYKDKNFIIEGDNLGGYSIYYQKKDGSNGVLVKEDTPLYDKVMLSHAVSVHPERVVTLTDMQYSPSYFVTPNGRILSLNPTTFGEEKDSVDIHNRVMAKLYGQEEVTNEDDILPEETENFLNDQKAFKEDMKVNGKNISVPAGSNPNNMPILETKDTIYLMNDGQQEAYTFIGGKVKEILNTRKKVTASDLNDTTMAFTDNLSKKFNGVIPQAMWDNMIGLAGRGGVGKTTVIKAIIDSIKSENKYSQPSVMYLAPGHTPATVLQESMGLDSEKANDGTVNTIASHLRKRPNESGNFSLISEPDYLKSTLFKPAFGRPDIIVIDEGSMIGVDDIKDMVIRLKSDLNEGLISKLPVFIFMGDYRQLGPIGEGQNKLVNKGAISSTLFLDKSKTKELTKVMRSDNEYLHQIYDSIGEQIISNMDKTKNGEEPVRPSFKKYDVLTKKSTESILVVNNKDGVVDDYATYLATNNNPYGMFWVHYNKVDNPITKNLNAKIRKAYFEKAGLPIVEEKHRLFAKGDYVEFTGGLEIDTDSFEYVPENNQIEKILENLKYPKKGERYTIVPGVIKPNARVKVLDIVTAKEDLSKHLHPSIRRVLDNPNIKVDVETSIIFNRQNKIRAVSKVLDISVGPMTGKNQFGTYDKATKRMKGITIKNTRTGEVLGKFDLPYSTYLDVVDNLLMLNSSDSTMPFVPSYVGSSHTAQGNTIKNVIVGDDNIKAAAANGKTNIDDIFSSMYVGLTRTSGTLTIVKPMGFDLINNQSVYMGAITDTNNKLRPKSAIQPVTSVEEADYYEEERNDQEFDINSFILGNIKQDVTDYIFNEPDTKKILNKIYKTATPLNKQLLDLVSKTGGVDGLKIIVDNNAANPGAYDPATKIMTINPTLAIEDNVDDLDVATQQMHEVVMHELIHHVTADLLNADPRKLTADQRKWVISLNNLFETVQNRMLNDPNHSEALQRAIEQTNTEGGYLSTSDKSQYYGLTNVHDFVSMLMSDAGFREFMNNTKFDGNKSILDRFLDILTNILKALGINVKDDSVLKEGITNIVGLIESRNQNAQNSQNDIQRSIATKSSKVDMISDNFEELLKILNIKSYC